MAKRTPSSAGASYGQWDAVNGIDNISDAWSRYKATQISTPSAQARKFFTTAYKRAQMRYSPTMGRFKGNPKRKRITRPNSSPLLPAKVRINPRTGKVQVFVSPKVAAQVKGNRRNPWFSRTKDAIKGNRYMVLDTDKVPVHAGILTKKQALEVAKEARQAGEKVRLVKAK